MAHYDDKGRFKKGRRPGKPAPLKGGVVNHQSKTSDGQHLLVRPDLKCDGCGKLPRESTLIKLGDRLLCRGCYEDAPGEEQKSND